MSGRGGARTPPGLANTPGGADMTDATPPAVPSPATRRRIRWALRTGAPVEGAVRRFAEAARRAIDAFDAEIDPLHLPNVDYEVVVNESGLRGVLGLADRMTIQLSS